MIKITKLPEVPQVELSQEEFDKVISLLENVIEDKNFATLVARYFYSLRAQHNNKKKITLDPYV